MSLTKEHIFNITTEQEFNQVALTIFNQQIQQIAIYQEFVDNLSIKKEDIKHYTEIPFLPIEFFKQHAITANPKEAEIIFTSSGTTGTSTSKHFVKNLSLYTESYQKAFALFYGAPEEICIIALLPSYLEREGSSLIYMVDDLIKQSKHPESGFLLDDYALLYQKLNQLKSQKQKTILIGVTYALLDFIEQYLIDFPELIIMETGGMKGKRKEIVREELHKLLGNGFGVQHIHSEYGMTELLSQAYSKGNGIFNCPPWMKVLIRDVYDPLSILPEGKTGGINVIDLANINSCSFIATQDLGKIHNNASFEVLGRFDHSDIRGCNLMLSS